MALAGVPDGIRPVVAPIDVPEQYKAFLEKSGKESDPLACEPLWAERAVLCFRVWEKKKRRWVTEADLAAWSVTTTDLHTAVATAAAGILDEKVEKVQVEGTTDSYLRLSDGDGWAAALVLAPKWVEKKLGVPFLAAVPSEGVSVAWSHGKPELDHIMAVGVTELYEEQEGGVSAHVHSWDGQKWRPFGVAKPR